MHQSHFSCSASDLVYIWKGTIGEQWFAQCSRCSFLLQHRYCWGTKYLYEIVSSNFIENVKLFLAPIEFITTVFVNWLPFQNVPNSHFCSVIQFIPEACYFTAVIELKKETVVEGNSFSLLQQFYWRWKYVMVLSKTENCSAHFLQPGR